MRGFSWLLSFGFLLSCASRSQRDPAAEGTAREHPFFRKLSKAFDTTDALVGNSHVLKSGSYLALGKAPREVTAHYKKLFEDMADMVGDSSHSFGSANSGYYSVKQVWDAPTIAALERSFVPAMTEVYQTKKQKSQMTWEKFSAHFQGKPRHALSAILLTSAWCRSAYYGVYDIKPEFKQLPLTKLAAQDPGYAGDGYAHGSLADTTFALDFTGKEFDFWGKGYKTIAGMSMATALLLKGYSAEDTLFGVSRAAVAYEASDLMYDHLGYANDAVFQVKIQKNKADLRQAYGDFIVRLAQKVDDNPSLGSELAGAVAGVEPLPRYVPRLSTLVDFGDLLQISAALIALAYEKQLYFYEEIYPLLKDYPQGKQIYALFRAARKDVAFLARGAGFAADKMKNDSVPEKKWEGVFGKVEFMRRQEKKGSEFYNFRIRPWLDKEAWTQSQ